MEADLTHVRSKVDAMGEDYVTVHEFRPVKQIVYGLAGIILTTVSIAIVQLVIQSSAGA